MNARFEWYDSPFLIHYMCSCQLSTVPLIVGAGFGRPTMVNKVV